MNPRRSFLASGPASQMGGTGGLKGQAFPDSPEGNSRDISLRPSVGPGEKGAGAEPRGSAMPAAGQEKAGPQINAPLATRTHGFQEKSGPDKTIVHEHPREPKFFGATARGPPPPNMDATNLPAAPHPPGIGLRTGGFQ